MASVPKSTSMISNTLVLHYLLIMVLIYPLLLNIMDIIKLEETLNTYTHLFNSALNEVVDLINKLD